METLAGEKLNEDYYDPEFEHLRSSLNVHDLTAIPDPFDIDEAIYSKELWASYQKVKTDMPIFQRNIVSSLIDDGLTLSEACITNSTNFIGVYDAMKLFISEMQQYL